MTKQETTGDDLVEKTRSEEAEITQGDQEPTIANLYSFTDGDKLSSKHARGTERAYRILYLLDYALN